VGLFAKEINYEMVWNLSILDRICSYLPSLDEKKIIIYNKVNNNKEIDIKSWTDQSLIKD